MKAKIFSVCIAVIAGVALFCGCKNTELVSADKIVAINDISNRVVEVKPYLSSVDSLPLITNQETPVGQVVDACVLDNTLYVVDDQASLFSFNMDTGKMKKHIQNIGMGPQEYVSLQSVTCDANNVYVLDMQGRSVITYDKELTFVKKDRLSFTALDFAKVNGGFLFYNMTTKLGEEVIVYTDEQGNERNRYLASDMVYDFMMTTKVFVEDYQGHVYVLLPMKDEIYEWKSGTLTLMHQIRYGNDYAEKQKASELKKARKAMTVSCNITPNYVVTTFSSDRLIHGNLYDKKHKTCTTGLFNYGKDSFNPQWQYKNVLYSFREVSETEQRKNEETTPEYIVMFYQMRE